MEVKINIEANQIGDTVIDLFKNLSTEKKEELALSVMKEWLQSPGFFETRNKEQLIIEEFRTGIRQPAWVGYKYDENTPSEKIKEDRNFEEAMRDYKNSKQILVEDLKNEVVEYYKKYISEELKENETINNIKVETLNIIASKFPDIIYQVLIEVFVGELTHMQSSIKESVLRHNMSSGLLAAIRNKVGI